MQLCNGSFVVLDVTAINVSHTRNQRQMYSRKGPIIDMCIWSGNPHARSIIVWQVYEYEVRKAYCRDLAARCSTGKHSHIEVHIRSIMCATGYFQSNKLLIMALLELPLILAI